MEIPVIKIQKNLKHFTPIYKDGKEVNLIPDNTKVTVYCEGTNDSGFLTNVTNKECGLELLIAKSWILETDLRALVEKV